jgi:succinate dehydrogenase / fumarate reductase cytochrome b subunit
MSNSVLLKSSLAKKYWMAATGLFLCTFLIGHLAGNLQLMMGISDADALQKTSTQFNEYAYFMTHNPFIKILSYLTYFSILFHSIDGIMLTIQNRKARPVNYAFNKPDANSKWQSRNMALLGSLILAFILMHMWMFWGIMHFGDLPEGTNRATGHEIKDLYSLVLYTFALSELAIMWVIIYTISMVVLALHLMHGFQSAFQSLGLNHAKWTPIIKKAGMGFAILIPLLFAIIPIYMCFVLEIPEWMTVEWMEGHLGK